MMQRDMKWGERETGKRLVRRGGGGGGGGRGMSEHFFKGHSAHFRPQV